jgi:hypothetical protein
MNWLLVVITAIMFLGFMFLAAHVYVSAIIFFALGILLLAYWLPKVWKSK